MSKRKKDMKKGFGIFAALMAIALGGFAQDRMARVDARQQMQHVRIRDGGAAGQLTQREAMRLRMEQMRIRRSESMANADGQVTRVERMRLHRQLQRVHRDIRRQKHDRQSRVY